MDPAPDTRRQLGQIMVEEGFVTADQLQHALSEQNRTGQPLGKVLVDLGLVSPGAVANALAEQHGGLLRTEYGTSTGLRELAGRAAIRVEGAPPAQAPAAPEPAPVPVPVTPALPPPAPLGGGLRLAGAAAPEQPAPAPAPIPLPEPAPAAPELPPAAAVEPEPQFQPQFEPEPEPQPEPELQAPAPPPVEDHSERVAELESKLHAVLTERNSLAQSLNEAHARLAEAAHSHQESVTAEAEQRIHALESQLQGVQAGREELERAHAESSGRVGELESRLAEKDSELNELGQHRDALQAELEQARSQPVHHEHSEDHDALVSRIAELDQALHDANAQRDEAAAKVAALEPELASVRDRLGEQHELSARIEELERALESAHAEREAVAAHAGTPPAEIAELRRQVSERDRELADSVSEMAKMSREHRALLQLVERQLGDEERGASPAPERTHVLFVPSASGYTLVEREGVAPAIGAFVELTEPRGRYVVRRLGPSPLPGPKRRCAYLERV